VRQYATVKEVRAHSERGKAAVPRVVGTVATLPCCDMGVIALVSSWVRAPCGRGLAILVDRDPAPEPRRGRVSRRLRPRPWGIGRVGTCVRGPEGSGESELASEALRGRASRNLRLRPWGVGRVGTCVRGPESQLSWDPYSGDCG